MNTPFFRRSTPLAFALVLALGSMWAVPAQKDGSGNVRTTISPTHIFGSTAVAPYGGGSLSRNNDAFFGNVFANGLAPGTVATLWVAVFNNPQYCAQEICVPADFVNPFVYGSLLYGGGRVVGADGYANFGAYRRIGDNVGAQINPGYPNPSPGLTEPRTAQIHFVIRTHGPASADPAVLQQQLTMFNGGCPPNSCVNVQAAVFR